MNRRLVRLYNDYKEISQALANNPYIAIKNTMGNPPDRYQIEYNITGLEQIGEKIVEKHSHLVEIVLTLDYPTGKPICRALTPVFHPNIEPRKICIADHWAAGESLVDIIVRIGEMICYQNYNIKSPLDGEAVKWVLQNINRLPLDNNNLSIELPSELPIAQTTAEELEVLMEQEEVSCPNCGSSSTEKQFMECANGHLVCSDCIVECQMCGKMVCLVCSLSKCTICGIPLCNECQITCPLCDQTVCKKHIHECTICENEVCSQCISECSECQKPYCKDHFNQEAGLCIQCAKTAGNKIRITYKELSEIDDQGSLQNSTIYCKGCGYKIQKNATHCMMCGKEISSC